MDLERACQLLEVDAGASFEEAKQAYKQRALQLQGAARDGDIEATRRLRELHEAWTVFVAVTGVKETYPLTPPPAPAHAPGTAKSRRNPWVAVAAVVGVLWVVGVASDSGSGDTVPPDRTPHERVAPDSGGLSFLLYMIGELNTPTNCQTAFTELALNDPSVTDGDREGMVASCVAHDQSAYYQ